MELSLTSVATRRSRKATLRVLQQLIEMKQSFRDLKIGKKKHYCLMATLIGEPDEHFHVIPNSDEIYQVEVGYGNNLEFNLQPEKVTDSILLGATLDAVGRVIESYPDFSLAEAELIAGWFHNWRQKIE